MMVTSVTLNVLPWFGSVAMRPPSLCLEDRGARRDLLALVEQVPGASVGLKVAALLLVIEGQRPGWIAEVLGVTRMSLNRWIHAPRYAASSRRIWSAHRRNIHEDQSASPGQAEVQTLAVGQRPRTAERQPLLRSRP